MPALQSNRTTSETTQVRSYHPKSQPKSDRTHVNSYHTVWWLQNMLKWDRERLWFMFLYTSSQRLSKGMVWDRDCRPACHANPNPNPQSILSLLASPADRKLHVYRNGYELTWVIWYDLTWVRFWVGTIWLGSIRIWYDLTSLPFWSHQRCAQLLWNQYPHFSSPFNNWTDLRWFNDTSGICR